ncbi:MAG: XisI protein [Anaerolineae bacterium]|nr:XisI protein [Anaerolineae bacterium]
MAGITDIVREEVEKYAGETVHSALYPIFDEGRQIYTVLRVKSHPENQPARAVVMARVVGEHIIIEADTTDKPLVDALVQKGIPRQQIVLAYAGEKLPAL